MLYLYMRFRHEFRCEGLELVVGQVPAAEVQAVQVVEETKPFKNISNNNCKTRCDKPERALDHLHPGQS